jgi:hypothetical protein
VAMIARPESFTTGRLIADRVNVDMLAKAKVTATLLSVCNYEIPRSRAQVSKASKVYCSYEKLGRTVVLDGARVLPLEEVYLRDRSEFDEGVCVEIDVQRYEILLNELAAVKTRSPLLAVQEEDPWRSQTDQAMAPFLEVIGSIEEDSTDCQWFGCSTSFKVIDRKKFRLHCASHYMKENSGAYINSILQQGNENSEVVQSPIVLSPVCGVCYQHPPKEAPIGVSSTDCCTFHIGIGTAATVTCKVADVITVKQIKNANNLLQCRACMKGFWRDNMRQHWIDSEHRVNQNDAKFKEMMKMTEVTKDEYDSIKKILEIKKRKSAKGSSKDATSKRGKK